MKSYIHTAAIFVLLVLSLAANAESEDARAPISFEVWYRSAPLSSGGEAASAARRRGLDYDSVLRNAYAGDAASLQTLVDWTVTLGFDGAAGEVHSSSVCILLATFGDINFAKALSPPSATTKKALIHVFGQQRGFSKLFPRTAAVFSPAETKEP